MQKVKSFAGYLKDVQRWENEGSEPSSLAARIKDRELAAIHALCNSNNIFLRQGKKGKCLPKS